MSPLRITTLTLAAVLTALSSLALADTANGGVQVLPYPLVLALTCASLAAWISFVALTVGDDVCGRQAALNKQVADRQAEIAAQIAGITEMVGEYGDQREARGYLAGVHDTNSPGHLTRVK